MSIGKHWMLLAALSLFLSIHSGCITLSAMLGQQPSSTLDTKMLEVQGYSIPAGGMPSPVAPDTSGKPRVVLEVREEGRHLESIPLPMDQPLFIEDLVQQARLHDRFGELSISIMRPSGSQAPPIRLETATDDAGKAKSLGQNYALLPGDHIIVAGDNRSSLERLIDRYFKS